MPYYKDQSSSLYFLESDADPTKYLPSDCVEITDSEAEAIRLSAILVPTFADLQEAKRNEVRAAYAVMDCDNYTAPNLVVWNGGYDSAQKLYAKYSLAKETAQISTIFYDISNIAHELTLPEALSVCVGVATNASACFDRKQELMVQIDAAATEAELNLIQW